MKIQKIFGKKIKEFNLLPIEIKLLCFILFFSQIITDGTKHFLKLVKYFVSSLFNKNKPSHDKKRVLKNRKKKYLTLTLRAKLKYSAVGGILSLIFIFSPLLFLLFLQDLPNPTDLVVKPTQQTTKIYDRSGVLLAEVYASQNRTIIPLSEVPKYLQDATIAIEDKNFYNHPGFDLSSIIRAAKEDLSGKSFQGGSTITQQLIKSSMLTPEPTLGRKIKEVALAFWSERIYTKKQILGMYLNQVPYGGTAWGVEAASAVYFNKHVKDLDLSESAFLAGLTAAPTTYSPFGNNKSLWKKRQEEVLSRMVALSYITNREKEKAIKKKLVFNRQRSALKAPHFVEYVKNILAQKYGIAALEKGGLNIITTLDSGLQFQAEEIVKDEVEKAKYLNLTNGAALVTNPKSGDILAMVGSKDFNDPVGGNVNIATSLRQPGSSIKIVTYSTALMNGFTAASLLDDSPQTFVISNTETYSPVNYDGKYHGRLTLRMALANSLNLPAVKVLNKIGIPTMVNMGKKMGIASWNDPKEYGLSVTLGGAEVTMLDMAEVNGTLANHGQRVELNPILKITDYKGDILEKKEIPNSIQVLPKGVSYIISDILADNQARSMAFGSSSPLLIPNHFVSVKTGTSDNKRDNWANGYTENAVVISWVGNNNNAPMSQSLASGITGAAPIWHRVMEILLKNSKDEIKNIPGDIVQKSCFGKNEYFIKGTENSVFCGPLIMPSGYIFQNQKPPLPPQQPFPPNRSN